MRSRSASENDSEARHLETDLQDLPEPLRTQIRQQLFLAQPSDIPALEQIATTLHANGHAAAAARVRQKIAQLKGLV